MCKVLATETVPVEIEADGKSFICAEKEVAYPIAMSLRQCLPQRFVYLSDAASTNRVPK